MNTSLLVTRTAFPLLLSFALWVGHAGRASAQVSVLVQSGTASPSGNTYSDFDLPSINASGQIAFRGFLNGGTSGTNTGIYRGTAGVAGITQILREGDNAPGGGFFGDGIPGYSIPPALTPAGQVAFATFPASNNTGVRGYFLMSGQVATNVRLAGLGDAAPNGNGLLDQPPSAILSVNASGQAAFYNALTGTTGGSADNEGIFRAGPAAGSTVQIAREGAAPPAGDGTFGSNLATSTAFSDPALNNSGRAAFFAGITGSTTTIPGTTSSFDVGIYSGNGGALTQIARAGQTGFAGGGTITGLSTSVAINNVNQVAFTARLSSDSRTGNSPASSVFRNTSGTLTEIAYQGENLAIGGFIYGLAGPTVLNDAGQVATMFTLSSASGGGNGSGGILRGSGGALTIAGYRGESTPRGGVTILSSFASQTFAMNASGNIAFTALLDTNPSDVVANDSKGLFFYSDALGLIEIAQEGDSFGGSTISGLSFAGASAVSGASAFQVGLNDANQVAFYYNLANGGDGIGYWVIPEPATGGLLLAGLFCAGRRRRR